MTDAFATAIDVFAAGVAARPWLFAFVTATVICVIAASFNVAEHQGWRAAAWGLAAISVFAIGMALPI